MISVKINSNNNLTFNGTNTGKLAKVITSTTKSNPIASLIGLGGCIGMGMTYQIHKNRKGNESNTCCEKTNANPIKLKEQAIRYNEKEEEPSNWQEDFLNRIQNMKTKIKAKEDAGEEITSEDLELPFSLLSKKIEERLLPDFSETELDEDFYNDLNNIDCTPVKMDDLKKESIIIKNKQLKTITETICKKEQLNRGMLIYIRDIDAGINNITDSKILNYIKTELKRLVNIDYDTEYFDNPETGELEYLFSLEKIANIVDVYNTMTGKYSRYKTADLGINTIYLEKSKPAEYIKDFRLYSPKNLEKFIKALNTASEKKHPLVADFESSLKTEALELLSNNKEMLDYMYEKYYISKITDAQAKKLCREINRTYGVRVLLSNKTSDIRRALRVIKKELDNWTKVSGGKAKLPRILDLNPCDVHYEDADAYTDIRGNIHHKGARIFSPTILRHEIMHANEPFMFGKFAEDAEKAKLIRSIIPSKKEKIDGKKKEVLDWDNCKYREEFLKAGINPEHVEYAYTNVNEFLSVAAEGDLSQYSPEFREVLMKIGMPEYVFKLPVENFGIETNVERVKKILKKHPKAKYDKLLYYIEEAKSQELSPEDKLLNAIFGKNWK